jgi:uncharacterized protein with PIN domain
MSINNITVCPHCNLDMELKMAPFERDGAIIGNFEAYVCPNCGRVFYTDNGYNELNKFTMKKKN